jgi:hypothetical protein
MKLMTCLLLSILVSITVHAQDSTLVLSTPIDITEDGWNKLLQLKNGNTMLFHFELHKKMVVKIFDKARAELTSNKCITNIINLNRLDEAFFDGVIEINNEAVMFITQDVNNSRTLIRIRINTNTGNVIAEDKIVVSESFRKQSDAFLYQLDESDESYNIFTYAEPRRTIDTIVNFKIVKFTKDHKIVNERPISFSMKGYENARLISLVRKDNNLAIAFNLVNGSYDYDMNGYIENALALFYMPNNSDKVYFNVIHLPLRLPIHSVHLGLNMFDNKLNVVIANETSKFGISEYSSTIFQSAIILPLDLSEARNEKIVHSIADNYIKSGTGDTSRHYSGYAASMQTNENGMTSVLFEEILLKVFEQQPSSYYGNLCLTNYDDNFKEISATVIPMSHHYVFRETFPEVFRRCSRREMFTPMYIITKKNKYVIFNDVEENFNKTIPNQLTPVYSYTKTNAVCYKLGRKNSVQKEYFFKNTAKDEYKPVYISGYDYDEAKSTLAIMTKVTKNDKSRFHIAWRKMED